jgi:hypothetical protein
VKIIECVQGSAAWWAARIGRPTASNYDRILTPRTAKPSAAQAGYVHTLCAEWLLGQPLDEDVSEFMARGTGMEEEAARYYAFQRDVELEAVGFCESDDGETGCSVDRFSGADGIVEIKCPGAKGHVAYLLGEAQDDHRPQIQGQLWITGRTWVDLVAYHPQLPTVITRYERDDLFLKRLADELPIFCAKLNEAKERLIARGYHPPDERVAGWLKTWLERNLTEATP